MVDKHSHIELYEPKSDGDWADFAKTVAAQINRCKFGDKTIDVVDFMSALLNEACVDLDGADLKKLEEGVNERVNDALAAQRKDEGKKAKSKKYTQVNLDDNADDYYYEDATHGNQGRVSAADFDDEPVAGPVVAEEDQVDALDFFASKKKDTKKGGGGKKGGKNQVDQKELMAQLAAKMQLGGTAKPAAPMMTKAEKDKLAAEKEAAEKAAMKARMLAQMQEEEEEEEEEPIAEDANLNAKKGGKKKPKF